jgi:hypothetical protein
MERIVERKVVQIAGDFTPSCAVGDTIRPGTIVGIASTPDIREEYPLVGNMTVLVDDGVFVSAQTPLFSRQKGFRKEIVGALHDGLVKVHKNFIRVVAEDEAEHEVKSSYWGRIVALSEDGFTVETKRLKMPIFLSLGSKIEGELLTLFDKGLLVAPQHIKEKQVDGRVVVLPGALSYEVYMALMSHGALGVVASSVDWHDYVKIFAVPNANVAILHGFGMFPLWQWYYQLLSKVEGVSVEIDFNSSYMYIPVSDILLGGLEHDLLLFKEFWWGKQVKELQHESGVIIAQLETGETTPVSAEELFNIR